MQSRKDRIGKNIEIEVLPQLDMNKEEEEKID